MIASFAKPVQRVPLLEVLDNIIAGMKEAGPEARDAILLTEQARVDAAALILADKEYDAAKVAMYQLEGKNGFHAAIARFERANSRRQVALANVQGGAK